MTKNLCDACHEFEATRAYAHIGRVCEECFETLSEDNVDESDVQDPYAVSIQAQIDAEPEIHIPDGE